MNRVCGRLIISKKKRERKGSPNQTGTDQSHCGCSTQPVGSLSAVTAPRSGLNLVPSQGLGNRVAALNTQAGLATLRLHGSIKPAHRERRVPQVQAHPAQRGMRGGGAQDAVLPGAAAGGKAGQAQALQAGGASQQGQRGGRHLGGHRHGAQAAHPRTVGQGGAGGGGGAVPPAGPQAGATGGSPQRTASAHTVIRRAIQGKHAARDSRPAPPLCKL